MIHQDTIIEGCCSPTLGLINLGIMTMSSTEYENGNDKSDDANNAFIDLVGDDIKPLSGKVSAHLGKPALITPGVI